MPDRIMKNQQGAVLIVSMLILLILTILGITAMSTTTLEEKMTSNFKQRQIAFQSASSALRDAEAWLLNPVNILLAAHLETKFNGSAFELFTLRRPTPATSLNPVSFNIDNTNDWGVVGNGKTISISLPNNGSTSPKYIIEYMGRVGDPPLNYTSPDLRQYAFRITAIGWGTDNTTTYITQSSLRRMLN